MTMNNLKFLIIGAGNRGNAYSKALDQVPYAQVTGIVEPFKIRREKLTAFHTTRGAVVKQYSQWQDALQDCEEYDAVFVCVLDALHKEIAVAFADKGKHLMCEKPMATTWKDCQDIFDAVKRNNVLLAVGHVLRYSPHNIQLKQLLDEGVVGDIININHTEPVGWYHFAHSYVRGNWRKKEETTFSLMAKCCHDIDVLMWFLGSENLKQVSSFGSLSHFKKENKPKEAGDAIKCTNCAYESQCPYSAKQIYLDTFKATGSSFLTEHFTDIEDEPAIIKTLNETNYGTCVYESDNDVCDHQVVNLNFGSKSATMTMIAFSEKVCERRIAIYGTRGEITTDSSSIEIFDFKTQKRTIVKPPQDEISGHGGGDRGLVTAFSKAIQAVMGGADVDTAQKDFIRCTPEDILMSHKVVFLAEQSRLASSIESVDDAITI